MAQKPWEQKWEPGDKLGDGGHGVTRRARPRDAKNGYSFALKVLKSQNSAERRQRLHNEVLALTRLNHSGIAKYVDGNTEHFADLSVPLYLVTDLLPGGSLEGRVQSNGTCSLSQAIELLERILNALEYCHQNGVLHRDIKPDNVLFAESGEPVLIDFGQCYLDDDDEKDSKTPYWQDIGNRFIVLPEQRGSNASEESKRDQRSDIAAAVGLLYYVLTGEQPGVLVDHESKLPHQREKATKALAAVSGSRLSLVNQLFDRAFDPNWDRRFQTITELRAALARLSAPDEAPGSLNEALEKLISSPVFQEKEKVKQALDEIGRGLTKAHSTAPQIAQKGQFASVQSGCATTPDSYGNTLGFRNSLRPEIEIMPRFEAKVVGAQIVVTATWQGDVEELWRFDLYAVDTHEMQKSTCDYFDRRLAAEIQRHT